MFWIGLICVVVPSACLIIIAIATVLLGRVHVATRSTPPPWLLLYACALLRMCTWRTQFAPGVGPLTVRQVTIPPDALAKYCALFNIPSNHAAHVVPTMFIPALSFQMVLYALTAPSFPMGMLGAVLARHSITVTRALQPTDVLDLRWIFGSSNLL